jgi:structural maintenance of chromosome 3 (chondroitin sulfate proteoglycan 6)
MYIKAVTIHGFKSYKDPTTIELSAACNVVVGRNGAGKSNFFAAIRFVLGDIFTNLRPEERQALLHEGAGLAVMSAFVEVVFDNSDNRFPIDREEVVLRRSIGLKKDEYFLDKKHVTKSDVGNLLESAGFSKSNPYYIVQQGKITSLTLMKDPDRLELLKEVAGCKVYDERRQESERIMKDTESRREKVVEVVTYIEDRLRELEDEKEELREFQSLDREKRALEYTIYDQELKAARTKLQRLEVEKVELAEQLKGLHDRSSHRDSKTQDLEVQLKAVIVEEQASTKEKRALATDTKAVVKNRTRLELDLQESAEQQRVDAVQKATLQKELEEVSADIAATEIALQDIQPRYESELDTENQVKEKLADAERELHELYSKQGRHEQFGSKDDRDKWLKQEIKQMRSSLKDQEAQIATVDAEVKGLALEKQNTEDGAVCCRLLRCTEPSLTSACAGLAEKSTHQTALRQVRVGWPRIHRTSVVLIPEWVLILGVIRTEGNRGGHGEASRFANTA